MNHRSSRAFRSRYIPLSSLHEVQDELPDVFSRVFSPEVLLHIEDEHPLSVHVPVPDKEATLLL